MAAGGLLICSVSCVAGMQQIRGRMDEPANKTCNFGQTTPAAPAAGGLAGFVSQMQACCLAFCRLRAPIDMLWWNAAPLASASPSSVQDWLPRREPQTRRLGNHVCQLQWILQQPNLFFKLPSQLGCLLQSALVLLLQQSGLRQPVLREVGWVVAAEPPELVQWP